MNNWKEKIPAIFAEQGDILEVPLDAQTDSQVSFETGYTANYERDAVDDLGNPLVQYGIERTKFNYLMKVITSALKEIQETIPTYEDNGVDKVDVSSIVTETNAFDVLESILCINADTGKASKITKDDIIKNLNPDVDLSNSNISVSQLATTAVDNFLALDGDIVKKADKLLQEAIAEINLSADNVVVSASATVDVVDSVIVMNTDGKVAKATTIPQEKIEEINLSKDNIAIDEYTDQEQGSVFKPLISSDTGSVYRKDKLEGSMIESIKFEQIEDDVYARSINYTIMTSDTYPDGIDNLIQTGVYHVITPDEYKDIINDQIDTADKEEYILKVMNSFLTNLNMIKEPFTDVASLVAYAGSDFISPYEPIIQVLGVSANGTDDTNVTQVFKLNGEVKGQRTFTATTSGLENEVWIPVSTYIRDTIEEEFIAFMYDGVPDEATSDVNILRTFKTIGYNNKEELSYGFSFGGFNCYDVITIDTDLDWTDKSDTVDSDVYVAAYTYNQSLLTIDDTKIIKLNGKVIENESDITNVKDVIFFVKDRTHNIKYIALGKETGGAVFTGYLFDASNDEFLDTTKAKNFFRPNYHLIFDAMSCTNYYNFSNTDIKLRNVVIGTDVKMFPHSTGVNTDTVIAKNLIVKDSSFNPVMTVTSASTTLSNELVVSNISEVENLKYKTKENNFIDLYTRVIGSFGEISTLEKTFLKTHSAYKQNKQGETVLGIEIDGVFYSDLWELSVDYSDTVAGSVKDAIQSQKVEVNGVSVGWKTEFDLDTLSMTALQHQDASYYVKHNGEIATNGLDLSHEHGSVLILNITNDSSDSTYYLITPYLFLLRPDIADEQSDIGGIITTKGKGFGLTNITEVDIPAPNNKQGFFTPNFPSTLKYNVRLKGSLLTVYSEDAALAYCDYLPVEPIPHTIIDSTSTIIDGDLTVTGNLQADSFQLPENITASSLTVTDKAILASTAITGKNENIKFMTTNGVDDNYVTSIELRGSNTESPQIALIARESSGKKTSNITIHQTTTNSKIYYEAAIHGFVGTVYENNHRLAPMPVVTSNSETIGKFSKWVWEPNSSGTLPDGGTWLTFRIVTNAARNYILGSWIDIQAGGTPFKVTSDQYVAGWIWKLA